MSKRGCILSRVRRGAPAGHPGAGRTPGRPLTVWCWKGLGYAVATGSLGLLSLRVGAEATGAGKFGGFHPTSGATQGLLGTAAGLLLVLATIVVLAWALRRYGRFPMAGKGLVNVLGGTTLGSRERVVVVQVEDVRLVLGVAPGRIQTLYVLDPGTAASPDFSNTLETEMPGLQR